MAALVVSCRCKHALLELRHLKSEAREATKLLEDKKVLEVKVRTGYDTMCCATPLHVEYPGCVCRPFTCCQCITAWQL
jgi:hypothetical protein